MEPTEGRRRVCIENVSPEIDAGRFAIKRTLGEDVVVEANVFADSHDSISCVLRYRHEDEEDWTDTPMVPLGNDRWQSSFVVARKGSYLYTVQGWIDHFKSWRRDLQKKVDAGYDVAIDLRVGANLVAAASERAEGDDAEQLAEWSTALANDDLSQAERVVLGLDAELALVMDKYPDKRFTTDYGRVLRVIVERKKARYSTWYEMFPRSCGPDHEHGTFKDAEKRLPYVAEMGFDVLYLPPIHPIGRSYRKGPNNTEHAGPDDPGSPWAIGAEEGGHKSIHPKLGTLENFRNFVKAANDHGLDVALDIAFQCSPDHPYVEEHPEWFKQRPDGTIQYAENPPKKYQDIYPFDFETENWQELWQELKSIFVFWIEQGVEIFRVDNPHTKAFSFWEWVIEEIKQEHPDVIFLSEAFTRPNVMYRLAKVGFTQSYNYFPWRNTKWELTEWFRELTRTDVREFFRPNLWPNTPDILPEYLQLGGRPAFKIRVALAATLGASYGIYGPAFELCENTPVTPRSEEYLDSEKYEIKDWDLDDPASIKDYIARINQIRKENPALQQDWNLEFHPVNNEELICYSKHTDDGMNIILVVVNLDPHHTQTGFVALPLDQFGVEERRRYQVYDLLSDTGFLWHGERNYVELAPEKPAYIFHLRRHVRTEHDFEYYL